MKTLHNEVVVITGAASGIGRALALECARRGARRLIGADAKILDLVYRLVPARSSAWLSAVARRRRDAFKAAA